MMPLLGVRRLVGALLPREARVRPLRRCRQVGALQGQLTEKPERLLITSLTPATLDDVPLNCSPKCLELSLARVSQNMRPLPPRAI